MSEEAWKSTWMTVGKGQYKTDGKLVWLGQFGIKDDADWLPRGWTLDIAPVDWSHSSILALVIYVHDMFVNPGIDDAEAVERNRTKLLHNLNVVEGFLRYDPKIVLKDREAILFILAAVHDRLQETK